eukprot:Nk52_evm9s696 gene=Nk52_evmTU9s696
MSEDAEERIVEAVEEFFFGDDDFEAAFRNFAKEHLETFKDLPEDIDDAVEAEQKLEYHDVYKKFQELYENMIEDFLKKKGIGIDEFYEVLRKKQGDKNSKAYDIATILVATQEYDVFTQLIHHEREQAKVNAA